MAPYTEDELRRRQRQVQAPPRKQKPKTPSASRTAAASGAAAAVGVGLMRPPARMLGPGTPMLQGSPQLPVPRGPGPALTRPGAALAQRGTTSLSQAGRTAAQGMKTVKPLSVSGPQYGTRALGAAQKTGAARTLGTGAVAAGLSDVAARLYKTYLDAANPDYGPDNAVPLGFDPAAVQAKARQLAAEGKTGELEALRRTAGQQIEAAAAAHKGNQGTYMQRVEQEQKKQIFDPTRRAIAERGAVGALGEYAGNVGRDVVSGLRMGKDAVTGAVGHGLYHPMVSLGEGLAGAKPGSYREKINNAMASLSPATEPEAEAEAKAEAEEGKSVTRPPKKMRENYYVREARENRSRDQATRLYMMGMDPSKAHPELDRIPSGDAIRGTSPAGRRERESIFQANRDLYQRDALTRQADEQARRAALEERAKQANEERMEVLGAVTQNVTDALKRGMQITEKGRPVLKDGEPQYRDYSLEEKQKLWGEELAAAGLAELPVEQQRAFLQEQLKAALAAGDEQTAELIRQLLGGETTAT